MYYHAQRLPSSLPPKKNNIHQSFIFPFQKKNLLLLILGQNCLKRPFLWCICMGRTLCFAVVAQIND
uniref:Uncharacterized protein n=1 Tax=Anguilla anguilla TaxID=7936 RepID=A0A0E9XJQ8_ANGAN